MKNPFQISLILFAVSSAFGTQGLAEDWNYPVAGTTPWQRPQGAPTIEWVHHDRAWYQHALTGISPPYPRSLYFLDNQGNWYTPFNHPGMLPPYDIRGWHKKH